MRPRHGEVWRVDMGIAGKVRPSIVLLAEDLQVLVVSAGAEVLLVDPDEGRVRVPGGEGRARPGERAVVAARADAGQRARAPHLDGRAPVEQAGARVDVGRHGGLFHARDDRVVFRLPRIEVTFVL